MVERGIRVRGLTFAYPGDRFRLAVNALALAAGERLALVGPSGSGKTTLLELLAGIRQPVAGRVEVAGVELTELEEADRQDLRLLRMGLVFQGFELLDYLSVLENVLLPYRLGPVLRLDDEARARARELLRDVGLGDRAARLPGELSQGERQRVAVCRALVTRPAVLLADEPTGNLDPESRDRVMEVLADRGAREGATQVLVTHDPALTERLDRVVDVRRLAP